MRFQFFIAAIMLILLAGCKKSNLPVNYTCLINGSTVTGNAFTEFNPGGANFIIQMSGANNSYIDLTWFDIDSVNAEKAIIPKTYTMPNYQLPPYTLVASYISQYQYGNYNNASGGGSITITSNTGPGGVISGTFNFKAYNTNPPYDSVVVTQGSFTNVPVASD